MRAFIAAVLTPASLEQLGLLQEELRRRLPRLKLQSPANQHLTLVFLGEQPAATLEETSELVLSVGRRTPAFDAPPTELRLLGRGMRKRPLCLMLEPLPELLKLHRRLTRGLEKLGLETEKRRYLPHLTLGRIDPPLPEAAIRDALPAAPLRNLSFERLVLFGSRLLPQGAQHDPLSEIRLRNIDSAGRPSHI